MFLYKNLFFLYLLLFQSQSCLLESTAAIFRQSAGYVFFVHARQLDLCFHYFFFTIQRISIVLGHRLFTTRRRVLEKSFFGSGMKVSANSYEFYANSPVFHVFY